MRHALLALLILSASPLLAAEKWIRLTTPDFELYTSAGEKKGRETLRLFEQVRGFFLKASPVQRAADFPVRVIQFASSSEFQLYNPKSVAAAYFTSNGARNYIVLGDAALENPSLAIHEYTHLIIQQSGLRLPIWLNEGWADIYSSLRAMGKETAIGDLLPDRIKLLQDSEWLDFDTLTRVGPTSKDYNEASRVGIFYAESWALAHMLYFAPEYRAGFGKFLTALTQGKTASEACLIAWNKAPALVFADLHAYFDRRKIYGTAYAVKLDDSATPTRATPLNEFESRLFLADLSESIGNRAQAKQAYESLDAEQPGRPDVAQALGYFALRERDEASARRFFTRAFAAGSADPRLCFDLAILVHNAGELPAAIPPLERALKSKPDFTDAKIELGVVRAQLRDFPAAVAALMQIGDIGPERAPAVFCTLSYALLQTGDLPAARRYSSGCRQWARTDPDKRQAAMIEKLIEGRSAGIAEVRPGEKVLTATATLQRLDCSPQGSHLVAQAGDQVLTLELPPPAAVEVEAAREGTLTLNCGPQQPRRVTVDYVYPTGIVRRLVY